jgi:hypothetical protein
MAATVARLTDHTPKHRRAPHQGTDPVVLSFPGSDPASDPYPAASILDFDVHALMAEHLMAGRTPESAASSPRSLAAMSRALRVFRAAPSLP